MGAGLSPSGERYGNIPQKQRAVYRHQPRHRQRRPKHVRVCAVYQYHVGVVRKGAENIMRDEARETPTRRHEQEH